MKAVRHGGDARDPLLHIEADGVLINVRVGLTDNEGHHVTNVSISPDDRSRGGDGEGYYWYQDGARIIRLNPGEEPPVPGGRFKVGETVTFSVMHTFVNGVIEEYHERSQSYLVRAEDDGLLWLKEDQLYAGPDGTSGQDRESYSDTQDRKSYSDDRGVYPEHSNDIDDWCPWSGEPRQGDDTRCPAGCRRSEIDPDDEDDED